jgi:hypothetical protein
VRGAEDEVVALRKDLDKNGHEVDAATIAFYLEQRHGVSPAGVDDLADPEPTRTPRSATNPRATCRRSTSWYVSAQGEARF